MSTWPALTVMAALLATQAAAQSGPTLLVQAEAQSLAPVCTGRDVQLEGNHNVVTPFGICRSLLLKGVANRVTLTLGADSTIQVQGNGNHVLYTAPAPSGVTVLGPDNTVTATPIPPAVQSGPGQLLRGADQARAVDCTGQDVDVQGDRALYVLHGGCRSLTIHGALITVQADMMPGAAITITGHGIRVGWTVPGAGRPPVMVLHGENNHVERLGER